MGTNKEVASSQKYLRALFIGFFSFLIAHAVLAVESIKILEISSSGRSVLLDRGSLAGVKEGLRAKILLQTGSVDKPRLSYVADGEVIKSAPARSFWILRNINQSKLIRKGQRLVFVKMNESLSGRRKAKLRQKKVILTRGTTPLDIENTDEKGIPEELIQEGDEYDESDEIVGTDETVDYDTETTNFDFWSKRNGVQYVDEYMDTLEKKHINKVNKVVSSKKVRDENDRRIFDSMVKGTIKKTNNLKNGLRQLYREQEKIEQSAVLRKRLSIKNTYDEVQLRRKRNSIVDKTAKEKINREGPAWSAEYTDEELRAFLIRSGLEEERRKQALAMGEKDGNELLLRFTQSLTNHTTGDDINNQGSNFSLLLGYEWHLRRTSENLERWALEFNLLRSVSNFDLGGINGRFAGGSFGALVNYYFYNNPSALNKYMWYIGTGIKRGNATVTSADFTADSYKFSVLAFPSFHIGMKYRFQVGDRRDELLRFGLGLNVLLGFETIQLTASDDIIDNINGTITTSDMSLGFGLSFYF